MLRMISTRSFASASLVLFILGCVGNDAARAEEPEATGPVNIQWAVRIPVRDGVKLNATVYRRKGQTAAAPCIFTLTPYIGDFNSKIWVKAVARRELGLTPDALPAAHVEKMLDGLRKAGLNVPKE